MESLPRFFEVVVIVFIAGLVVEIVISTIINIYRAIVYYREPELVCSNCGKKITKEMYKCPKCKSVFVSEDKKKVE